MYAQKEKRGEISSNLIAIFLVLILLKIKMFSPFGNLMILGDLFWIPIAKPLPVPTGSSKL